MMLLMVIKIHDGTNLVCRSVYREIAVMLKLRLRNIVYN